MRGVYVMKIAIKSFQGLCRVEKHDSLCGGKLDGCATKENITRNKLDQKLVCWASRKAGWGRYLRSAIIR